jgi:hypothetical protein
MGNCSLCHAQVWTEIPGGRRLEMDKRSLHICKQQNSAQTQAFHESYQSQKDKRIDELALMKVASFEKIAEAISKSNSQTVDALYFVGESLREMASAIKALVDSKKEISATT